MERFVCVGCKKKRNINFLGIRARFVQGVESNICVNCWENKFNCDKTNLVRISYNYENIILNKKESVHHDGHSF